MRAKLFQKSSPVTVTFNADTLAEIERLADRDFTTRVHVIRELIDSALAALKREAAHHDR